MKLLTNESAVAYGHLVAFIGFFAVIGAFILIGTVVDIFEDFLYSTDISYSASLLDRVGDLTFSFQKVPFMLVAIMLIFIVIRALKRGAEYR